MQVNWRQKTCCPVEIHFFQCHAEWLLERRSSCSLWIVLGCRFSLCGPGTMEDSRNWNMVRGEFCRAIVSSQMMPNARWYARYGESTWKCSYVQNMCIHKSFAMWLCNFSEFYERPLNLTNTDQLLFLVVFFWWLIPSPSFFIFRLRSKDGRLSLESCPLKIGRGITNGWAISHTQNLPASKLIAAEDLTVDQPLGEWHVPLGFAKGVMSLEKWSEIASMFAEGFTSWTLLVLIRLPFWTAIGLRYIWGFGSKAFGNGTPSHPFQRRFLRPLERTHEGVKW